MNIQTPNKSSLIWLFTAVIFILVFMSITINPKPKPSKANQEDDFFATVDGFPIHANEFQRAIHANKSVIIRYFYEKYGAEQSAAFWNTSYGGEFPLELLKKKALEDTVNLKIQQIIAMEQGVLTDISYGSFEQNFNQENERRQKAINNNQVVFGPAQYTEEAYLEYVMGNSILSVKNRLMERDWKPNDEQLKTFYETKKDQLYKAPATVKVQQLSASFIDGSRNVDEKLKDQIMRKMETALAKSASGLSFEQAAKELDQTGKVTEQLYNLDSYRHNARSPVAQAAAKLRIGEISGIIEENGHFHLIQRIENERAGSKYLSLEDIKEQALRDYIDHSYKEYVRKRMADAQLL
ncbi:peptidyl-prolyl cis-trans isomerase [Paenibacillus ihbetae]|uniref:peptidylprolyl isomerase n=1 Tax=Paenibacillus ihbetae TaxID=1870820 RepID=UPI001CB90A92|nr:peptidylprolyl isomerase [Paenibacillus ihbetae]